jgi:hypothetical protein
LKPATAPRNKIQTLPIEELMKQREFSHHVLGILFATFLLNGLSGTVHAGGFDGERAYGLLLQQVQLGPRVPGSNAAAFERKLILSKLVQDGFSTGTQSFDAYAPLIENTVHGVNLYGIYPADKPVKYMISAHYDSRPRADMERNPERSKQAIAGANDGASGVAILLELASVVAESQTSTGVALVFFDCEDLGQPASDEGFCLGSRFMADNLPSKLKFEKGINLDMVGDADLRLTMEGNSVSKAETLVNEVWNIGAKLHPNVFVKQRGPVVFDDHMPFLSKNYPYIDIIDFEYPFWHTLRDTADKCSPQSLKAVGDVLSALILR